MVAIASAMMLGQKVILLDEPSANLDYHNTYVFRALVEKLKQEGYTEKFLKEEIGRFFKEINAPLYRMKDSGNIIDEDIKQINMIAMELLSCFMKDKCLDLSDIYQKLP